MSIIDRVKQHYRESGRKRIDVDEWGNGAGPLSIYWTPLTLEEQSIVFDAMQKSNAQGMAKVLILKAEDENGDKLFAKEDLFALTKAADGKVATRIANLIMDVESVADAEKKSEAIPPSLDDTK